MALGCVCPVYSTARIETSPIVSDKGRGAQPSQTAFLSLSRFQSRRLEDKLRVALSPSFYQALLQVALGRWCGTRRQSGSSGQTLIHAGEAMNVPLQEESFTESGLLLWAGVKGQCRECRQHFP